MSRPTSSSTSEGYGSIEKDNRDGFEASPLLATKSGSIKNNRTRNVILGALCGFIVVLIGSRHSNNNSNNNNTNREAGIRIKMHQSGGISSSWSSLSSPTFADHSFKISPTEDMGMLSIERNDDALPSSVWGNHLLEKGHPLPTNSWYLNLVSHRAAFQPDDQTRVYTVPYIIDTASPFPSMEGLRVHWPVVQASSSNVQMVDDFKMSLCIGAEGFGSEDDDSDGIDGSYRVKDGPLSHLGVGLEWGSAAAAETSDIVNDSVMSTNVVRGMPYATMEYNIDASSQTNTIPTIYSYNGLASDVQIDRSTPFEPQTSKSPELECGGMQGRPSGEGNTVLVKNHLHLHMINSDFTWMVFFSEPVRVSCTTTNHETDPSLRDFKLSIVPQHDTEKINEESSGRSSNLVVRAALLDQCTTGQSSIQQHCSERNSMADPEGYERLLKTHAHAVPNSPTIDFEYSATGANNENENGDVARLHIDWDATSTKNEVTATDDLLMFGLPHHQEYLSNSSPDSGSSTVNITDYCVHSFHGNTCLVQNSNWILEEPLGDPLSFLAPRPPSADLVPTLAEYLVDDINFKLSDNTLRGACDTYFSGKTVARLARIITIAGELRSLAEASSVEDVRENYYGDASVTNEILQESIDAAASVDLPSSKEIQQALDQLKKAVTVWLRSNSEAPYIYDESWGGLINCGCHYVGKGDKGHCKNSFPDCPALASVNEDFGNGYYNDHHYHYGYHVYAAAVAARLDPSWGREHFDEVLLYVRDFANPSEDDEFFPQYRQKDWFLGSSWASGIVSAENSPHGRNEESSSEAISAYEGVTLWGSAMVKAFEAVIDGDSNNDENYSIRSKLDTAKLIRDSGQLLVASELHATNRYWHVWSSDTHTNTYPSAYAQPVVGMLYDTMATFQTWFAPWAVVSYGIQLIPLTPVTETRDDIEWATELYPLYEKACRDAGDFCEKNGWSILQAGLLATTGNHTGALEQARAVPSKVFATDGGVGNSMSNTIWYIATRKNPV